MAQVLETMCIGPTGGRERLLDHVQNQFTLELLLRRKKLFGRHRGSQGRHRYVELLEGSFGWWRNLARKLNFLELATLEVALGPGGSC